MITPAIRHTVRDDGIRYLSKKLRRDVASAYFEFAKLAAEKSLQRVTKVVRDDTGKKLPDKYGFITGGMWYDGVPQIRRVGWDVAGDMGWSDGMGSFFEFGTDKKEWTIKPSGLKTDGTPVKFLRFEWRGEIVYAKEVTVRYSERMKKEHVGPAIDKADAFIRRQFDRVPELAFGKALRK